MANHPHHDDDQSKKTPGSGATPKRPIPNMSLDDDEPFVVEEVVEAEVIPLVEAAPEDALPIVEAAPESDIVAAEPYEDEAATVLSTDDVVEEIAEAMPASDVLLSMEQAPAAQAETPEPHAHVAHPASDVKPSAAAPASEVNLAELFGTAYAPPVDSAVASASTAELPVQPHVESAAAPKDQFDWRQPVAEEIEAVPGSTTQAADDIAEVVEDIAEAQPASEVVAAEEVVEEVAEAQPASEVVVAEEVVEEVAEAEPVSEVVVADEVAEAQPVSEVVVAEEVVEAEPASAVIAAEEVVEEPISAVVEAEEFVEAEAAEASDVLAAEEVADISAPSEMKSGELVEEVVEEIEEAEPASAVAVQDDDVTEFVDTPALLKAHDSAVLAAEPVHSGSSAVLFDEVVEETGHKKKSAGTADVDKTVAFVASPSSATQKAEPDSLVTEEEVIGEAEPASAVNLGEGSGRKSSATGIDEVAEALESGVGLDSSELANTALPEPPEPSVEFDEILDDEETAPKSSKKKKGKFTADEDEAEVAEAAEDAEIFDSDEEPVSSVKMSKVKAKATGDDIDLDNIFSEAEAAEAVDADEAVGAEAEAAEADEAFAEAAADDDAPKKKKFKGDDVEAEAAEAVDADADVDEDVSAKKKKGKDKKDKATVAPQSTGSSAALVWAGRLFLVFVGMILVSPLFFFLTPEAPKQVVVPPPPKVDARTPLDKYRDALAKGEYETLTKDLETATDEAELDVRGQARWFAYAKQQADKKAPLNKAAPEVKAAREDLDKAKNVAMIAQIDAVLNGGGSDGSELAKLKKLETMLRAEKAKTDKVLDGVAEVLVKGDYLKDKKMFSAAVLEKIMQSLSEDRTSLEALNKILTDAKYKDGEEGLKSVLKEKKAADDSVVAINKVLADEKTKDKGAKGVLEIVDARNKANADLTGVAKDRDDVLALVKRAYDELGGPADKADPRKELIKAIQQARVKAESPLTTPLAQLGMSLGNIATGTSKTVEQTFAMSKVFAELGFFRTREAFIDTPQQKMDLYIMLLQDRKENNAKALGAIITEAGWVLTPEAKSTPEQQAKARYVQGLALRNQEKFSEAKIAFADALKRVPFDEKSAWAQFATQSQKELIDPNAYYLPRTERFQSEGNFKAAVDEINAALKAMPDESRLYAQRGLIRYEMARGQGAKVSEVLQKGIREDAEIAGKNDALAAESLYIVGLLEEELGNVSEAEKLFRSAIKTRDERKTSIDDGGKYRIALGRVLLRDRSPVLAVPPMEDKKGKDDKVGAVSTTDLRFSVMHPWTTLTVSALIAQPGGDDVGDKEISARLDETVKLAKELIASPNPKIKGQGYLLLGSAYSKQGRRTDGLKEYSKGLQLLYPGMQTQEMTKMIEEHPAFQQPDSSSEPNPVMAERHFGDGMHFYWSKQYTEAETQFRQAVKFYKNDARYYYFLGLAQFGQGKRTLAINSIEEGARLEARTSATNPLAVRDINASLERIQGELRATLNSYRYRANSEPDEPKKSK